MKVFIRSGGDVKTVNMPGIAVDKSLFRHFDSLRQCYWSAPGAPWDVGIVVPRRDDAAMVADALKGALRKRVSR
jgi:hypothetical protein